MKHLGKNPIGFTKNQGTRMPQNANRCRIYFWTRPLVDRRAMLRRHICLQLFTIHNTKQVTLPLVKMTSFTPIAIP